MRLDGPDYFIEVDATEAWRLALEHVAQPVDDLAGALRIRADVDERLPHLLNLRLGKIQKTLCRR